jgi:hypothetical protein
LIVGRFSFPSRLKQRRPSKEKGLERLPLQAKFPASSGRSGRQKSGPAHFLTSYFNALFRSVLELNSAF